jgi:hypothetical protein
MATSSIHISLPPRNEPTQAAHRPVGLLPALVARVAPQPQAAGGLFNAKPAHVQHQSAATAPPCSGLRRIRSPRALARTTVSDHPVRSSHRGGQGFKSPLGHAICTWAAVSGHGEWSPGPGLGRCWAFSSLTCLPSSKFLWLWAHGAFGVSLRGRSRRLRRPGYLPAIWQSAGHS